MKNQNKTRFEVGMPVIAIMSNKATNGVVDKIDFELKVLFVSFEDAHYADFSLNGAYRKYDNFITLFTLPEYKALKALTDSFVDGTFGKEQTDLEQPAQPQPETTDLLGENGQPVYFEVGMEVGCIYMGCIGQVFSIDNKSCYAVTVKWSDGSSDLYTLDGRYDDEHSTTLYPIEQYKQIQLPKLKPIQVAKPKEDVISLPSSVNESYILANNIDITYINSYIESLCKLINDNSIAFKFHSLMRTCGVDKFDECIFYKCTLVPTVSHKFYLDIHFLFNNKKHELSMNILNTKDSVGWISYKKNGETEAEKI